MPLPLPALARRPRWVLRQPDPAAVAEIVRVEGCPELLATLLVNRGYRIGAGARRHLRPKLERLHDPRLLPGMAAATARLARALRDRETVLVHGDYDVDGVTGTALLVRLLRELGADVRWHIPNRFTDGYSFGEHSLRKARETGAGLVVSVDNGTSANETIARLAEAGVDTIVTDHHEPPLGELPAAAAIVNAKLEGSSYPFRELCGGAVAFKLAWGLCQEVSGSERVTPALREFLVQAMGYVAIATVCDVVPLEDENRILARFGLRALEGSPTPGLAGLLRVCGLAGRRLTAEDVGFQVGPRINAAGRLGSARTAVELLLAEDAASAAPLAARLDELNRERKLVEQALFAEAAEEARRFEDAERWPVLVVAGQGWHQGVVGIVAARLVERFRRPALVIGLDGAVGRGSARSIAGFDVLEALRGGAVHLLRHGGHAAAAGCELEAGAVDELREAVCERARAMLAGAAPAEELVLIDCELCLSLLTPAAMASIERLEPFGERNAKPVLLAPDARLAEPPRRCGADGSHLLLRLRQGELVHKAMAFGMAAREDELRMGTPLQVVYTPRWNTFRGETKLELQVVDFRAGPRPGLAPG